MFLLEPAARSCSAVRYVLASGSSYSPLVSNMAMLKGGYVVLRCDVEAAQLVAAQAAFTGFDGQWVVLLLWTETSFAVNGLECCA